MEDARGTEREGAQAYVSCGGGDWCSGSCREMQKNSQKMHPKCGTIWKVCPFFLLSMHSTLSDVLHHARQEIVSAVLITSTRRS